jgi:hypothetical protein
MKKVKLILPIAAIMFAVAGVFATGNASLLLTDIQVTDDPENCPVYGLCDDTIGGNCKITSTNTQLYRTIENCQIAATGRLKP